jgi:hypothetical protein
MRNRDKMQRTTIADKQGWVPAADDTAKALDLSCCAHWWLTTMAAAVDK